MSERISVPSLDSARLRQLRLGSFILSERLGVGGMSEVWRAEHDESGAAVAVKLLSTSAGAGSALQKSATEALRQEILLLARLDHPGILRILEFGTVTESEAAHTGGILPAGSPYLVTPWARGGSLDKTHAPPDWPALFALLRSLLLALAHAHARGVVHRDLKPANILLVGDPERGPQRPVLSDFGIAFALARANQSQPDQLGTPAYMAPEQILGPPLEQGPATDLYALGCVAYRLAAGRAPFVGTTEDVLRSHVLVPAPPLEAAIDVPEGFIEWVAVLLGKQPHQRFPSAAFARYALESLAQRTTWIPARASVAPKSSPRVAIADAITAPHARSIPAGPMVTLSSRPPEGLSIARSSVPPRRPSSPDGPQRPRLSYFPPVPPPTTWRVLGTLLDETADATESSEPRPSLPDFELAGAGLGLYGLRRLDLAGRERERDALYQELLHVHRDGRCRAVILRGATGMGTTRLGEWLLEVASELDVGVPLRVEVGEARVSGDGVVELLERLIGTRGLGRAQAEARALAWARDAALSRSEGQDLAAVLGRHRDRFRYAGERLAAVRRALARGAPRIPLVILLDDAVVDRDCLELVRSALDTDERLPLLFVLTTSDELIEPSTRRGEERARALFGLAEHPRALELVLGPLSPDEHGALVERLLGLEAHLAREVVERTEGRPLFAVQLVGDWVSRGLLVPGLFGFTLRPPLPGQDPPSVDVPDGIHALFERRLDKARAAIAAQSSESDADEALIGLELAAILSPAPQKAEWHAVLDAAGVRAAHAVPELASRGLVRPRRDRLAIAHRMLRESLIRRAREGGRYEAHHRVIADVLTTLGADPSRLAAHRIESGDLAGALEPLLASADLRCARSDLGGALDAVRRHAETLDLLGAAPDDVRRVRGQLLRAEILGHVTLLEDATACLDEMKIPPEGLDPATAARLHWLRGVFAQKRGQAEQALGHFEQALSTLWSTSDPRVDREIEPRALYGVAESAKLLGDLERAVDAYEAVQARTGPDHRLAPLVLTGLSDLENRRGHTARALELGHLALELFEARGARHDLAIARNSLGDIERKRGNFAVAEAHYLAATAILTDLGSKDLAFVRMNLALLAMAEGNTERGLLELDEAEKSFTAESLAAYVRCVDVMRLPGLAARGDEAGMRRVLDAQTSLLETLVDPDLGWCLERALVLGGEALDPSLRQRLEALATSQRDRLG